MRDMKAGNGGEAVRSRCTHLLSLRRLDQGKEVEGVLTFFGGVAVTVMMLAYALERRDTGWILVFAVACAASSMYGWLVRAYPFGVVEAVWSVIALRRWWQARSPTGP